MNRSGTVIFASATLILALAGGGCKRNASTPSGGSTNSQPSPTPQVDPAASFSSFVKRLKLSLLHDSLITTDDAFDVSKSDSLMSPYLGKFSATLERENGINNYKCTATFRYIDGKWQLFEAKGSRQRASNSDKLDLDDDSMVRFYFEQATQHMNDGTKIEEVKVEDLDGKFHFHLPGDQSTVWQLDARESAVQQMRIRNDRGETKTLRNGEKVVVIPDN